MRSLTISPVGPVHAERREETTAVVISISGEVIRAYEWLAGGTAAHTHDAGDERRVGFPGEDESSHTLGLGCNRLRKERGGERRAGVGVGEGGGGVGASVQSGGRKHGREGGLKATLS